MHDLLLHTKELKVCDIRIIFYFFIYQTLQPLPKIEADDIQTPYAKALYSYENKEEPELLSFREVIFLFHIYSLKEMV